MTNGPLEIVLGFFFGGVFACLTLIAFGLTALALRNIWREWRK